MEILCLTSWGTNYFPKWTPFYIPTSNAGGLQILYIFVNPFFLLIILFTFFFWSFFSLANTSSTVLTSCGERRHHPCFAPDFREEASYFPKLSVISRHLCRCFKWSFIKLFLFIVCWVFIRIGCWILATLSSFADKIM